MRLLLLAAALVFDTHALTDDDEVSKLVRHLTTRQLKEAFTDFGLDLSSKKSWSKRTLLQRAAEQGHKRRDLIKRLNEWADTKEKEREERDPEAFSRRVSNKLQTAENKLRGGDFAGALSLFETCLEMARRVKNVTESKTMEGIALGSAGNAMIALGRAEEAVAHHEKALAISRELEKRDNEGTDLANLGFAYKGLERHEEALDHFMRSLEIKRELGDDKEVAKALVFVGDARRSLGQHTEAIELHQQALTLITDLGDRSGQRKVLVRLAKDNRGAEAHSKAADLLKQALDISRALGERQAEREDHRELADTYRGMGGADAEAAMASKAAMNISMELGGAWLEEAKRDLGSGFAQLEDKYNQALEMAQEASSPAEEKAFFTQALFYFMDEQLKAPAARAAEEADETDDEGWRDEL